MSAGKTLSATVVIRLLKERGHLEKFVRPWNRLLALRQEAAEAAVSQALGIAALMSLNCGTCRDGHTCTGSTHNEDNGGAWFAGSLADDCWPEPGWRCGCRCWWSPCPRYLAP